MTLELRWVASFSASCMHAAAALAGGRMLVDARLATLTDPLSRLVEHLHRGGVPEPVFWQHAPALAANYENNRELAQVSLAKTAGPSAFSEAFVNELGGLIGEVEFAFRSAVPNVEEELTLRGGPLRHLFDARGPGFLRQMGQLTDPRLIVANATVVLVHPALGGSGVAHLPYNSVRLEALLANPCAELPEVLRLGWLISQLQLDVPIFGETVHPNRLAQVAPLAMLPAALATGEYVELCRNDPSTLALALNTWGLARSNMPGLPEILTQWWQMVLANRPQWSVALGALDRLLREAE